MNEDKHNLRDFMQNIEDDEEARAVRAAEDIFRRGTQIRRVCPRHGYLDQCPLPPQAPEGPAW